MICKTNLMISMCGMPFSVSCDQFDRAAERVDRVDDRAAVDLAAVERATVDCAAYQAAAQVMSLSRLHPSTQNMPPPCNICSYKQPEPDRPREVRHRHSSSRQVRVVMGVENHWSNPFYLCPTCQAPHLASPKHGLNVCVSTSQLHNVHHPREEGVVCPPDSLHVDWLTIPGATIEDLIYAWRLDYSKETRPMRILLVAGLNDLLKGGNEDSVKEQIERFKTNIDGQNRHHYNTRRNEFSVATLLNPPKLAWFPDNGPPPPHHNNRLVELASLNKWIKDFNQKNGFVAVPSFQTWGTRTSRKVLQDGSSWPFKTHRWNEWRQSESVEDKLHLSDPMRVKMGRSVVNFFQGQLERYGPLV